MAGVEVHYKDDMKYVREKLDDLTEIVSPKKETIVAG